MSQLDVLIITALKEEYEAAREVGARGYAGNRGIAVWEPRDQEDPTPYIIGNYLVENGTSISVALARPTRMGGTAISPVVSTLVERLKPKCLAMSGVCAGNPSDVALGDVIVAELAYAYDEGKRTQRAFEADYRQIPLSDTWVREAQDLSPVDLPSFGEASDAQAKIWLLEQLNSGEDPRKHPARPRYFPDNNAWRKCRLSLQRAGFIARDDGKWSITEKGRSFVGRARYDDVEGPEQLPFKIIVGPMASGNVVVKDGRTWEQLKDTGVRTVVGLEMEAATIANIAHRLDVPNWVVVKGVMDYADPRKDDRYKPFAARASAEVLFKLLVLRTISTKSSRNPVQTSLLRYIYVLGGVTQETSYPDFEKLQLEQTCRQLGNTIALAGAELVVCSPFPDSADVHAILGYVESGEGRAVHLHSPDHPNVAEKQAELLAMLGREMKTRIVSWRYPGPENDDSWGQAWLLCQLQALEQADAIVSIGGRLSKTANTLLHLAEMRQKPVVPFAFLGGASQRAFARRDWPRLYPGFDHSILQDKTGIPKAVDVANHLAVSGIRGSHGYNWPPKTVFISRASKDSEFAQGLSQYLTGVGYRVLLGDGQVRSDRMIEPAIDEAILGSDLFVAMWSRSYALSRFCFDELELALQRHEVGGLQVWLLNLDGSDVVPRGARQFPPLITKTPQDLITVVRELLGPTEDAVMPLSGGSQ